MMQHCIPDSADVAGSRVQLGLTDRRWRPEYCRGHRASSANGDRTSAQLRPSADRPTSSSLPSLSHLTLPRRPTNYSILRPPPPNRTFTPNSPLRSCVFRLVSSPRCGRFMLMSSERLGNEVLSSAGGHIVDDASRTAKPRSGINRFRRGRHLVPLSKWPSRRLSVCCPDERSRSADLMKQLVVVLLVDERPEVGR